MPRTPKRFWPTVTTFFFPGFAQALVFRRTRAALWLGSSLVAVAACTVSVWALPIFELVHIGAAVDGYLCLRRDARTGGTNRAAAALVFAIGAMGTGAARLAIEFYRVPSSSMDPTLHIGDHILVTKLPRAVERGDVIAYAYPCASSRTYVHRAVAIAGDSVEVRCNVVYVNGAAIPSALVDRAAVVDDYYDGAKGWETHKVSRYRETQAGRGHAINDEPDRPMRGAPTAGIRDFPQDPADVVSCANAADRSNARQVIGTVVQTATEDPANRCRPRLHYVVPPGHVFVLGDYRNNANDSRVWGGVPIDSVIGRVVGVWWSSGPDGIALGRFGGVE